MIDMEQFRVDGRIDWERYRKAQMAAGERCERCGKLIVFGRIPYDLCDECRHIQEPGQLRHSSQIRCPVCRHHWSVGDHEDADLFQDGDHGVSCEACGVEFEVSTRVSFTFTSPALKIRNEDE